MDVVHKRYGAKNAEDNPVNCIVDFIVMISMQVPALKPKSYEITCQNDEVNLQCRNELGPSLVNCKLVSISPDLPEYIFVYTLTKGQNWNEDQNDDHDHTNTAKDCHGEAKIGKEIDSAKYCLIVVNVVLFNQDRISDQFVKEKDVHETCEGEIADQLVGVLCLDSDRLKQEKYLANF